MYRVTMKGALSTASLTSSDRGGRDTADRTELYKVIKLSGRPLLLIVGAMLTLKYHDCNCLAVRT